MALTACRLVGFLGLGLVIVGSLVSLGLWLFNDPIGPNTCIDLPDASYPALNYRGYDGAWIYQGHILGYTDQEDSSCVTMNPTT